MNITARMHVVMEEITVDVREFLQSIVGELNDDVTRNAITGLTSLYLSTLEALQVYQVICDESNNPIEDVDAGKLNVDILFTLDGSTFEGKFSVAPDGSDLNTVITQEFFMLIKIIPVPPVEFIKLQFIKLPDPLSIDIPVTEDEVDVRPYDEMPSALVQSLKV